MGKDAELGPSPRIGTGLGWHIAAGVMLGVAIFSGLAAAGGGSGAGAVSAFCLAAAGTFGVIGMAIRIAGVIERRLIAIERAARRN